MDAQTTKFAVLQALLDRPELCKLRQTVLLTVDPTCDGDFVVPEPGALRINPASSSAAFHVRHGLELAFLRQIESGASVLAGMCAARTAILFGRLEAICGLSPSLPDRPWIAMLGGDAPPPLTALPGLWAALSAHQPGVQAPLSFQTLEEQLRKIWRLLGPTEWLMETGGDARLRVDPQTGLNGYGCSHRPRPWAITYASSTASSVSERGYAAAEAARQRLMVAALRGKDALPTELESIRTALAQYFGVSADGGVILAASGTDCELFTLGLAALHPDARPLTNVLIAPEETGTGVPLAATGRHFADDTARGAAVAKGQAVAGYRNDTQLAAVLVRDQDGAVRTFEAIQSDCAAALRAAPGRCILHLLDMSKTGLLAPRAIDIPELEALRPGEIDVVVDACQARLAPSRVASYVRSGWMVQVTGSKFFTGPPFAGAVLVPPAIMRRLDSATLPEGLRDYTAGPEWGACHAARNLPSDANPGLLLRWQAALAEMQAFAAVPDDVCRTILETFTGFVRAAIADSPDLALIPAPAVDRLCRARSERDWDQIGTIISFALRDPETGALLDRDQARQVYGWLNADLSPDMQEADRSLARLHCHIGQPAPLPTAFGQTIGVLRISAGARLVSGEPSHAPLESNARLVRELEDVRRVLQKISLILRHRSNLRNAERKPTYL